MGQKKRCSKRIYQFRFVLPGNSSRRTYNLEVVDSVFFWQIQDLDLNDPGNYDLLESLSLATLEEDAAYSFIGYVKEGCPEYVSAERILTTSDIDGVLKIVKNDCFKAEIISTRSNMANLGKPHIRAKENKQRLIFISKYQSLYAYGMARSESRQSFYHELSTIRSSLDKKVSKSIKGPRRP